MTTTPPLIPGSNIERVSRVRIMKTTTLIDGPASNPSTMTGGTISNLNDPINSGDAATKAYADGLSDSIIEFSTISDASNVQYTSEQLTKGYILRDPSDAVRTDTLPSVANLVTYLGTSAVVGRIVEFYVQNIENVYSSPKITVDIGSSGGYNVIGSPVVSDTPIINCRSTMKFEVILTNVSSGTESASITYYSTIDQNSIMMPYDLLTNTNKIAGLRMPRETTENTIYATVSGAGTDYTLLGTAPYGFSTRYIIDRVGSATDVVNYSSLSANLDFFLVSYFTVRKDSDGILNINLPLGTIVDLPNSSTSTTLTVNPNTSVEFIVVVNAITTLSIVMYVIGSYPMV